MEAQLYPEGEIDLRKYSPIIFKRKKIIILIFLGSLAIAAVANSFRPQVYKATASMMIMPTLASHKFRLKSDIVLTKVIQKLNLKDSGRELRADELAQKLSVILEEPLALLEVTDVDPQKAQEIANVWAHVYLEYIKELVSGELVDATDFTVDHIELARKNLTEVEARVAEFQRKYKLNLMKGDLLVLEKRLSDKKKKLDAIDTDNKSIESLTKKFTALSDDVIQKELEFAQLMREVEIARDTYNFYSERINSVLNDRLRQLGDVKIISLAATPAHPMGREKIRKVLARAGIAGLMLGVFTAFCIEFWPKGQREAQ